MFTKQQIGLFARKKEREVLGCWPEISLRVLENHLTYVLQ